MLNITELLKQGKTLEEIQKMVASEYQEASAKLKPLTIQEKVQENKQTLEDVARLAVATIARDYPNIGVTLEQEIKWNDIRPVINDAEAQLKALETILAVSSKSNNDISVDQAADFLKSFKSML